MPDSPALRDSDAEFRRFIVLEVVPSLRMILQTGVLEAMAKLEALEAKAKESFLVETAGPGEGD